MNKQPDTNTLAGKIAVMQAAMDGKRIEVKSGNCSDCWDLSTKPCWDWLTFNYRIHPDDLNPPQEPKWRPWTAAEARGRWVKPKGGVSDYLITGTTPETARVAKTWYSFECLLQNFTLLDGSPCGVKEQPCDNMAVDMAARPIRK